MSPIKSALVAVIALAGLAGFSGAASATEVPDGYEQMTVRVAVSDLNLDSEAGVKVFLKRVNKAADRACGGRPEWQPVMYHDVARAYKKCKAEAMEFAVAQVDSSLVAVRYAEKTGRTAMYASR